MNNEFIRYIKYAGAFVSPKDMTRYSYSPYRVEKAVLECHMVSFLLDDNPNEDQLWRKS